MMKFFTTSLIFTFFIGSVAFSQKSFQNSSDFISKPLKKPGSSFRTGSGGCDTVNLPLPSTWHVKLYYSSSQSQINGFITGDNVYADQEKAAYFDVSSSNNTYLTKVWIGFGVANTNTPANLSQVVPIKVYDGTSGTPGTLMATVNKTLKELKEDVDNGNYSEVMFPTAINLPTSKKFFVSVDISNLVFSSTVKDSLAIFSSDANEVAQGQNGFGMEKNADQWFTFKQDWGADFGLLIHPFVSTNATCATILPVNLAGFYGERVGAVNNVMWTTITEQNNKGFEIQRSADGEKFTPLAYVPTKALNGSSSLPIVYQFTDRKPLEGNVYYRLKQMDLDGKNHISPVVIIKGRNASSLTLYSIYPNPAAKELKIGLNAPAAEKVTVIVSDLAGKVLMKQTASVLTGDNKLQLNVSNLASGTYLIKTVSAKGVETLVKKFVKE